MEWGLGIVALLFLVAMARYQGVETEASTSSTHYCKLKEAVYLENSGRNEEKETRLLKTTKRIKRNQQESFAGFDNDVLKKKSKRSCDVSKREASFKEEEKGKRELTARGKGREKKKTG